MPRLVSVGNVIVDIVMRVGAVPEPGGDIIASASEITAGGALNTLVAAKRDGLDVVYAGQLGSGPFGDVVRAALDDNRVDVVQRGLPDIDSGFCVALVDDRAERTFVTSVGAEGRLSGADLARVSLDAEDTVLVSGYGLAHPDNADAIVDWLEAVPASVRVVFDPSPLVGDLPAVVLDAVWRRADIVSANAREARLLSPGAGSLDVAAEAIARRAGRAALVRDGSAGCWVASGADPATLVAGFEVDAIDTSGAGDAHDGVLIAALSRGDDLLSAVRRANAGAALAVARFGPATAPTGDEMDRLLASGATRSGA